MKRDQLLEVFQQDKQLNELKIVEGNNLYVEAGPDTVTEIVHKNLNWYKEFEIENNSIIVKFNDINQYQEKVKYDQVIILDSRKKVEDLKKGMADQLNFDINQMIFRRGGQHGAQIFEDDQELKEANIFNRMSIYVEKGNP